jgi:glycosyltransferase involved in cell wall biosynthesis
MTVLHTVASLDADAGGPSRTVSATCAALSDHGTDVEILTTDAGGPENAIRPEGNRVRTTFVSSRPPILHARSFQSAVERLIRQHGADLVHDHGVWLPTNWASARAARRQGIPYVLTTRGMLEPWALNHHGWKKNVAWHAYQKSILDDAALLHATAPAEAQNLRDLGLDAPIVVAPNGVPIPDDYKKQVPPEGGVRTALFLSRIHPKKGLLNLMDAWASVEPDGWRLVVAGPDEGGHRAVVAERARAHGIQEEVSFPGSIPDDEKWALYRRSDLFVLPTFSENFGVVVAEALASGIPAITTVGAPWRDLDGHDCGWWIETGVDPLVQALADATTCTDEARLAMGRRGRKLVRTKYTWDAVAETLQSAYAWVLGTGSSSVLWQESSPSSSHVHAEP